MRVRVRGPAGQATLTFSDISTIADLREQIVEKTNLTTYDIKYGYPPKPLALDDYTAATKLSNIGVKLDGEQLLVSRAYNDLISPVSKLENPAPTSTKPIANASTSVSHQPNSTISQQQGFSFNDVGVAPDSSTPSSKPLSLARKHTLSAQDAPELPFSPCGSTMVLRIMPDDNSCLFRAFNTAFFGSMDNMTELRSIIAQYIQNHPSDYSEAILERRPDDYCRWIQTESAWGGSIELDILSKHFDIEICSIDVQSLRCDRYNEGQRQRCILVYSGIHYDTIALSPSDPPHKQAYNPPEFDTKVFDALDDTVLQTAVELCQLLQGQHYFTDTANFTISCNVCGFKAKGERGATEHATQTGHMDFGEAG